MSASGLPLEWSLMIPLDYGAAHIAPRSSKYGMAAIVAGIIAFLLHVIIRLILHFNRSPHRELTFASALAPFMLLVLLAGIILGAMRLCRQKVIGA